MKNYINEYERQATEFLTLANATIQIHRNGVVDHFPNENDRRTRGNRYRYRVTLRRADKSYIFNFYDSIANYQRNERPTPYDVLACLYTDDYCLGSVKDFADEYGYNTDTPEDFARVRRIYNACKNQYEKLLDLFGESLLMDLAEIN